MPVESSLIKVIFNIYVIKWNKMGWDGSVKDLTVHRDVDCPGENFHGLKCPASDLALVLGAIVLLWKIKWLQ